MKILLLTIAPLIWGAGFASTRFTIEYYSPLWSHGIRYLFAALICLPFLLFHRSKLKHLRSFKAAFFLSLGLILQTIGIKYTTLAKSGFLTSFYVLFIPIIMSFLYKKRFEKEFWICTFISCVGVAFMCELKIDEFNYGDLMIITSAFFFSFHILFIDKVSQDEKHPILFNFYQCFFAGIIGFSTAFFLEGPPNFSPLIPSSTSFAPQVVLGFIILSIFSSIIAFSIQVIVQKDIPPHIVSLIFLLESIFATAFGWILFGEQLGVFGIIGSILILIPVGYISVREFD